MQTGYGDAEFAETGAQLNRGALSIAELELFEEIANRQIGDKPAVRITGDATLNKLLCLGGSMDTVVRSKLGKDARPVRAILFDKRADANWALGWHQDRTIAVAERVEVEGFDHWSVKSGLQHVEPPFEIIEKMVTLRAHLDPCGADNAPLSIIPGSHRLGRLPETEIEELTKTAEPFACEAQAGDVWIYVSAIVHASAAAREPNRRRVLHVDYSAEELPDGLEWLGL